MAVFEAFHEKEAETVYSKGQRLGVVLTIRALDQTSLNCSERCLCR